MKGIFWNSRGLKDLAKRRFLAEASLEHRLDFIALSETGRDNFAPQFLNTLSGGVEFDWHCLPPRGRSGGILLGVRCDSLEVRSVVMGDFAVKFRVRSKIDGFNWVLVAVYGAAQPELKPEFLADLVRICGSEQLPILVGGDFNIIRRRDEKNNDNFDGRWSFMFNTIIESLDLREIELSGRQFTWANSLPNPTYEKLDRVLASAEWEQKFPLVTVQALTRGISDHTPLFVDSGEPRHVGNKNTFSFETSWFEREGFLDIVAREWARESRGRSPVERWQNKIRHLRCFLRGWAKHLSGVYKVEKDRLLEIIQYLDVKAESAVLQSADMCCKIDAEKRLKELLREEELKWALRAKVRKVIQGDANTQFFHLIANGKHRKKKIFQLEQDEGTIVGHDNLKLYITEYYKQLFGPPEDSAVSLDESRTEDVPQLTAADNDMLVAPFTEKEVFDAISQMENNKAPGPDGFPAEFYKRCWHIIKGDLLPMFHDLFAGRLQLFHLNFGTITLLPKKTDALRIEQFRPICLLNVSFKIFTKVGTNRLTQIAHSVVQQSQTAFMPDRNILEGVVVLHETLQEIHSKKLDGVIFKVDFEKAYDKVKWPFLQQALRMKGFHEGWRSQIETFTQKGSVGIKVNDDVGHYFQTHKGLRQGDPMSPILFNIVADMLAVLLGRAKEVGQIGGLVPHLVDGGISILQYADDTIIFMEHDLVKARNLKLLLCLFEQLSGLKINFHKSELFCFGRAKEEQEDYKQLFGCGLGELPFTYLGIPIHHRKLTNNEWKCIEDRFEKKLSCWKGKLMSYGGRLILINSVLTSMPMFLLSFFEVPVGVRKRLDFYRSRFFWQGDEPKRKYRLAKWDIICRPKDQGGMGIENLEVKNRCLLSKWLWKLSSGTDAMWAQILRNKYLQTKTLAQVSVRPTDSPFWKGLMKVKLSFFQRSKHLVGNGASTRFWEDTWLGEAPLAIQYPSLYRIVRRRDALVASVFASIPLDIQFRRSLVGNRWEEWLHLVRRLMQVQLSQQPDKLRWNLTRSGGFTVKSMYVDVINSSSIPTSKHVWDVRVPLKIKVFMWFLHKQVILTKDNLIKRNWTGPTRCSFCDQGETIKHLFFDCPLARILWTTIQVAFNITPPRSVNMLFGTWLTRVEPGLAKHIRLGVCAFLWALWNCRNDFVFNRSTNIHVLQVIFRATALIRSWSLLTPTEARELLVTAAIRWEMVARDIFSRFGWRSCNRIGN